MCHALPSPMTYGTAVRGCRPHHSPPKNHLHSIIGSMLMSDGGHPFFWRAQSFIWYSYPFTCLPLWYPPKPSPHAANQQEGSGFLLMNGRRRFYRFTSLSFVAAFSLCDGEAWNICSSDMRTKVRGISTWGGDGILYFSWTNNNHPPRIGYCLLVGEAGGGLGMSTGGGGGARLYQKYKT